MKIGDQRHQCPYCSRALKEEVWHSHFESVQMYKAFHCDCGRKISFPVNFLGSGHDNWDKKESWKKDPQISFPKPSGRLKDLENRVKIVKEFSMHP